MATPDDALHDAPGGAVADARPDVPPSPGTGATGGATRCERGAGGTSRRTWATASPVASRSASSDVGMA